MTALPTALSLHVVDRPVAGLRVNPRNARTHDRKQVRRIADSLKRFGFVNPVLISDGDEIVAGHGRLEAAQLIGLDQVPTIRLTHLSDAERRAYVIADNRLAELAGWDLDILAIELGELSDLDLDLDLEITGFEMPEIDLMIQNAAGESAREDAVELEPVGAPVSRPGDLWHLGPHRLVCGDARDRSCLKTLMSVRRASMVFTDPPYNVPIQGHVSGLGAVRHDNFAMASGEMSRTGFTAFLEAVLGNLARFSEPGSLHYVCMDWRHMEEILAAV